MPNKNARTKTHARTDAPTPAPTRAADLIAKAASVSHIPDPSSQAIAELTEILAHNDSAPHKSRVCAADAMTLIRGMGWAGSSRSGFESMIRRVFGRRSYGQA